MTPTYHPLQGEKQNNGQTDPVDVIIEKLLSVRGARPGKQGESGVGGGERREGGEGAWVGGRGVMTALQAQRGRWT